MIEEKEKRQVATIWLLTALIIILIAVIIGFYIAVVRANKQADIVQQYVQMQNIQNEQLIQNTNQEQQAIKTEDKITYL